MEYIGGVVKALLSPLFAAFVIAALGYALGGIKIKGISLGTAGVLVMALVYGIFVSYVPSVTIGGKEIVLYSAEVKKTFSTFSSLGTALFVTAVGLIAGPKFFRNFNKKTIGYLLMGLVVILTGALITVLIITVFKVKTPMALGLMTGALTSTPGLSAAKEMFEGTDAENLVTAGYGIAYLFGVLGVVFFVQLVPRVLKTDMDKERELVENASIAVKDDGKKRFKLDGLDFFPFMLTVVLGMILGSFKIPGINFSLGSSGGTLIMGLIVGHIGHIGKLDLSVSKKTTNFFRELGLALFLIGAGVPGGVNFISNVSVVSFLLGMLITIVPMFFGFLFGKYVFKFRIFNNLASITGGMTSTPALGTLISTTGTDEISGSYAATYPIALVLVVLTAKIVAMIL